MLLPADWEVSGQVYWRGGQGAPSCMSGDAQLILTARSPDGQWGFDILPAPFLMWISLQQMPDYSGFQLDLNAGLVQPILQRWMSTYHRPGSVCRVTAGTGARAIVEEGILPQWRPQSRVVSVEELPDLRRQLEALLASQSGVPDATTQGDVARVTLATPTPAGPVEEALLVTSVTNVSALHGHDNVSLHQQVMAQPIFLLRYPAGRKREADSLFATFVGSMRISPRWKAAMDEHNAAMQRIARKGAIDRAKIWAKAAREISDIQMQGWTHRLESRDRIHQKIVDQIREVQTVRNPSDGSVYELPQHYDYFINGKGEIVMSNGPDSDPTRTFPDESWTRMEAAQP